MHTPPIKRHKAIQPFSREHHAGLQFCWKLREGLRLHVEPERIKRYMNWFWQTHLEPHFEAEERYIFPVLPADHTKRIKALREHRELELLFAKELCTHAHFKQVEHELQQHIRFEERDLFNEVQAVASEAQLLEIEKYHTDGSCDEWPDTFWLKKK